MWLGVINLIVPKWGGLIAWAFRQDGRDQGVSIGDVGSSHDILSGSCVGSGWGYVDRQ